MLTIEQRIVFDWFRNRYSPEWDKGWSSSRQAFWHLQEKGFKNPKSVGRYCGQLYKMGLLAKNRYKGTNMTCWKLSKHVDPQTLVKLRLQTSESSEKL